MMVGSPISQRMKHDNLKNLHNKRRFRHRNRAKNRLFAFRLYFNLQKVGSNMKNSSVYYKAAELIANRKETYCCASLFYFGQSKKKFTKYFKPRGKDRYLSFYQDYGLWFGLPHSENQLARTLALLLMAEMESRGEL